MSLTLDEVAQIRFRMARRNENGYKVTDVDVFIDKVEEAFRQFENERNLMRREMESLQAAGVGGAAPAAGGAETQELRDALAAREAEAQELRDALAAREAEVQELRAVTASLSEGAGAEGQVAELAAQNQQLRGELDQVREELSQARAQRIISQASGSAEEIVVTTVDDAGPAVNRLLQRATEQATTLIRETQEESQRTFQEAEQRAEEIRAEARAQAEQIQAEAHGNAESILADAQANAEVVAAEAEARAAEVDGQAEARRQELFSDLEREQGIFAQKVSELRSFEGQYRANLTGVLEGLLGQVNSTEVQPQQVPELAGEQAEESETPRLDALASE